MQERNRKKSRDPERIGYDLKGNPKTTIESDRDTLDKMAEGDGQRFQRDPKQVCTSNNPS